MSIVGSNALAGASGQASGAGAGGFKIDRSLRFNDDDSAYLSRTPSSAGSGTTWTLSTWIKTSSDGTILCNAVAGSGDNGIYVQFYSNNFYVGTWTSSWQWQLVTDRLFRDPSAWFHLVVSVDTTQATASNRVKIYINGVQETSFSTENYPSQNYDTLVNNTALHAIGRYGSYNGGYFNGYLAEIHFVDGTALAATDFGEENDNGVWQAKEYSGTYGTNGFHLDLSDNSSNATLGNDAAGSNNWTLNNLTAAVPAVDVGGDPTVSSTDVPFSGGYSIAFDGNDRLRVQGPGTVSGDFTMECFIKSSNYGGIQRFFTAEEGVNSGEYTNLRCYNGNTDFSVADQNAGGQNLPTNQWNHIAVTRSGSAIAYYLNGSRWATDSSSASFTITTLVLAHGYGSEYFTGSISNARFVNGQALYTGASYTVPTATLTTTSQGATASNVTTLVAHQSTVTGHEGTRTAINDPADLDSLLDTPSNGDSSSDTGAGGEITGNYCVINPLGVSSNTPTISDGNLKMVLGASQGTRHGTMGVTSGKWYFEVVYTAASPLDGMVGVANKNHENNLGTYTGGDSDSWGYYYNGEKYHPGSSGTYGASWGVNDVMGIALDMDNGALYFSKNGTYQNSGDPTSGSSKTGAAFTNLSGIIFPCINGYGGTQVVNFGQRPFVTSAPSGYKCWNTANLPDPTIADGSTAFDIALWTGNGSSQTISGLNHSPDFVWVKNRSSGDNHALTDTVRGATKWLLSNDTNAELTYPQALTAFTSDGFSVGSDDNFNRSTSSFVGWTWDGGSSTVSNTDGTITSQVRANQTAGFSIVTATQGSGNSTWGHGLNKKPDFIVMKARHQTYGWYVSHSGLDNQSTKFLQLHNTNSVTTNSNWFASTEPTSSVITTKAGGMWSSGDDFLAYCWTAVEGYSAFGSYTGNGSTDGPFVYTGFRPKFVLGKRADTTGVWFIFDTERSQFNEVNVVLLPDSNGQEVTYPSDPNVRLDILSNGFKFRNTASAQNASAGTYIYAAFAENPFSLNGGLAR